MPRRVLRRTSRKRNAAYTLKPRPRRKNALVTMTAPSYYTAIEGIKYPVTYSHPMEFIGHLRTPWQTLGNYQFPVRGDYDDSTVTTVDPFACTDGMVLVLAQMRPMDPNFPVIGASVQDSSTTHVLTQGLQELPPFWSFTNGTDTRTQRIGGLQTFVQTVEPAWVGCIKSVLSVSIQPTEKASYFNSTAGKLNHLNRHENVYLWAITQLKAEIDDASFDVSWAPNPQASWEEFKATPKLRYIKLDLEKTSVQTLSLTFTNASLLGYDYYSESNSGEGHGQNATTARSLVKEALTGNERLFAQKVPAGTASDPMTYTTTQHRPANQQLLTQVGLFIPTPQGSAHFMRLNMQVSLTQQVRAFDDMHQDGLDDNPDLTAFDGTAAHVSIS